MSSPKLRRTKSNIPKVSAVQKAIDSVPLPTPMSNQQIFDIVQKHLLSQNKKSLLTCKPEINGIANTCAYRSEDGCKCAIGCLINDELYSPSLEGLGIETNKLKIVLYAANIDRDKSLPLLKSLQQCHDSLDAELWPNRLNEIKKEFSLQ